MFTSNDTVSGLRDAVLNALTTLPGERTFHVHSLVSSSRKHAALFPFAVPRPKVYAQDVLILVSEQPTTSPNTADALPRVFVTAVELAVYNIPSTSSGIVYVTKVDTTGQGQHPSPASAIVRTVLSWYANPTTRPINARHIWIQLFARAQGQYLFPNSADWQGKKPLSDVRLCGWWKRLLHDVVKELEDPSKRFLPKLINRAFYILPGMNELEALQSLGGWLGSLEGWTYGHPYVDLPGQQLPCPPSTGRTNLGHFIPSFDDDPKSRFLDEIAYVTKGDGVETPRRKKPRRSSDADSRSGGDGSQTKEPSATLKVLGELGTVSVDEFWERMSFRQECVSGAVTGFFTLVVSTASAEDGVFAHAARSPLEPLPGQVSCQLIKRVLSSLMTGVEFSTKEAAIKGTETIESSIKGLCDGHIPLMPVAKVQIAKNGRTTPPPSSKESSQFLAPPSTPPPRPSLSLEVSPNPFLEPTPTEGNYHKYIYGNVVVDNPPPPSPQKIGESTNGVTVLSVRRKKKRLAE